MFEFVKISFKNILRYKRRSFLSGSVICVSTFALLTMGAFELGMNKQMRNRIIAVDTGHIGVRRTGVVDKDANEFIGNKIDWNKAIERRGELETLLENQKEDIENICGRLNFAGMFYALDKATRGLRIIGIEPEKEGRLRAELPTDSGKFLSSENPYGIYFGQNTASALAVEVADDVTLMCNTVEGAINAVDFTVCGIFSDCAPWHSFNSYIHLKAAQELLDIDNRVTEFKLFLKESVDVDEFVRRINNLFLSRGIDAEVITWYEAGKFYLRSLQGTQSATKSVHLMLFIIVFGVVMDTMIIVMRERIIETGTLKALGTSKSEIFRLYLIEIAILCVIAITVGSGFASFLTFLLGKVGVGGSGGAFNFMVSGSKIYPVWDWHGFRKITLIIFTITLAAGFIPIRKALKMEVTESLRTI